MPATPVAAARTQGTYSHYGPPFHPWRAMGFSLRNLSCRRPARLRRRNPPERRQEALRRHRRVRRKHVQGQNRFWIRLGRERQDCFHRTQCTGEFGGAASLKKWRRLAPECTTSTVEG